MNATTDRTDEFHRLHASGCFVMPNPWDVGSARALAGMGFKALATTSAGSAWSVGRPDNAVGLDQTLAHLRQIAAAVDLPVNADFQNGYAARPEEMAANVGLAVRTGVAGLSIEDFSGDPAAPLFDFALAVERIVAARAAIDDSGTGVVLTARSEGFVWTVPISTRPSGGSAPTPRPARTVSTRPGSPRWTTWAPSWTRSPPRR